MRVMKFSIDCNPSVRMMNTARKGGQELRERIKDKFTGELTKAPVMLNIVIRKTKTTRKSEYPLNQPTIFMMASLISKSLEGVVYESGAQIIGLQAVKIWADESREPGIIIEVSVID